MERLQKIIRDAGFASRREAEQWILEGRVQVNGKIITDLGSKADDKKDEILVDGMPLYKEKKVYFLFFKPKGIVTTLKDPQKRKTIQEFFKKIPERVFPVGRLDLDTEGLLLVTNDGDLMQGLLHPSKEIDKTYEAWVEGILDQDTIQKLKNGVLLSDGLTAPAKVKILKTEKDKDCSYIQIVIHEGKNRQVRRMMGAVGHPTISLRRTCFASLTLKDLKVGEYRPITEVELKKLRELYIK